MADLQIEYAIEGRTGTADLATSTARETADYLQDMLGEFECIARRSGFDLLTYLLSMARVEAETLSRRADKAAWPDRR